MNTTLEPSKTFKIPTHNQWIVMQKRNAKGARITFALLALITTAITAMLWRFAVLDQGPKEVFAFCVFVSSIFSALFYLHFILAAIGSHYVATPEVADLHVITALNHMNVPTEVIEQLKALSIAQGGNIFYFQVQAAKRRVTDLENKRIASAYGVSLHQRS